jgi:hypothetical protein
MPKSARTTRRKRTTPKRKTKQRIEAIAASPLDYMLAVMRDPGAKPERRDEMAKAAAAYTHPQLAPIAADVTRLVGQLLAEIAESNAPPEKCSA